MAYYIVLLMSFLPQGVLDASSLGSSLAVAYLFAHSLIVIFAPRRPCGVRRILITNFLLIGFFLCLTFLAPGATSAGLELALQFLRLWSPLVFFWWAYSWAGITLPLLHRPGFSYDFVILQWEERLMGQPSLWLARRRAPWLTEACHLFYASYYFYTPVLTLYLYWTNRLHAFMAAALSIMLGYAISYLLYAVVPVWGPRWSLVEAGLLDPSEQRLEGYCFTKLMNRIMYDGIAHQGGAMPSAHSSTAIVFFLWSLRLWGAEGGIIAGILVSGMWFGAIYGRYHYVIDLVAGAVLGLCAVFVADWLILGYAGLCF